MNGEVCCILGVCCPSPNDQEEALAAEMIHDLKVEPLDAEKVSKWIVKHFDLAPAGTLAPYRDAILAHERKPKTQKSESD